MRRSKRRSYRRGEHYSLVHRGVLWRSLRASAYSMLTSVRSFVIYFSNAPGARACTMQRSSRVEAIFVVTLDLRPFILLRSQLSIFSRAVMHYLDRVLNPHSIVLIGASKDPAKRGNRAIKSLLADRYAGRIIPINPREREILGLECFPTVADAPGELDLAIVCTAAGTVPAVIEECGRRKVKGAILLAGGFSEA